MQEAEATIRRDGEGGRERPMSAAGSEAHAFRAVARGPEEKSPWRRVPRRRVAAAAWERLGVFRFSCFDSPLLCSVARSLYVFPLSLALALSLARWAVVEAASS